MWRVSRGLVNLELVGSRILEVFEALWLQVVPAKLSSSDFSHAATNFNLETSKAPSKPIQDTIIKSLGDVIQHFPPSNVTCNHCCEYQNPVSNLLRASTPN